MILALLEMLVFRPCGLKPCVERSVPPVLGRLVDTRGTGSRAVSTSLHRMAATLALRGRRLAVRGT